MNKCFVVINQKLKIEIEFLLLFKGNTENMKTQIEEHWGAFLSEENPEIFERFGSERISDYDDRDFIIKFAGYLVRNRITNKFEYDYTGISLSKPEDVLYYMPKVIHMALDEHSKLKKDFRNEPVIKC